MVLLPNGRMLQGLIAVLLPVASLLPLLSPGEPNAARLRPVADSADTAEILHATQLSVASALNRGVNVGGMQLRLNLSTSNVGVSWQLTL